MAEVVTDEPENKVINKEISFAKRVALEKARNAKTLKKVQEDMNKDIILSTLQNVYEKLNILDTRLKNLPFGGKTIREENNEEDDTPKKKIKKEDNEEKAIVTANSDGTTLKDTCQKAVFLFAFSTALRYGSFYVTELWNRYKRNSTDGDEMAWYNP